MSGRWPRLLGLGAAVLGLAIASVPRPTGAVGEDPAGQVAEAVRSLGPPGMVWGRLAVEEESPVGGWTPLEGVEVTLYPATPALLAELDQIRRSARTSGAQYESAVARVQAALAAHQSLVDRQRGTPLPSKKTSDVAAEARPVEPPSRRPPTSNASPPRGTATRPGSPATPGKPPAEAPETTHPWRQKTDPAGLFAFDEVPSGDWLVVAIRISPYEAGKLRGEPKPRQPGSAQRFLPREVPPAKEAEVWLSTVRVGAAGRVGLELTDRARWLAGPLRQSSLDDGIRSPVMTATYRPIRPRFLS